MLQTWQAIILGIVEGITEYLPISSTGHLILVAGVMGLNEPPEMKRAVDSFNIVIQSGAILAIVSLYWPRLIQMLRGALGQDDAGRRLLINLLIAFAPAMLTWPIIYPVTRDLLFRPAPVIAALFLGGVWMIWIDRWRRQRFPATECGAGEGTDEGVVGLELDEITPKLALGIGLFQWASLWPGTSRAMMTIGGGMMLGLRPRAAAEFSFLLGLPTIGAACVYELFAIWKSTRTGDPPEVDAAGSFFAIIGPVPAMVGFLTSAVVAAIVVKWFVRFLERRGLSFFGYYRILLSVVMGVLLLSGVASL